MVDDMRMDLVFRSASDMAQIAVDITMVTPAKNQTMKAAFLQRKRVKERHYGQRLQDLAMDFHVFSMCSRSGNLSVDAFLLLRIAEEHSVLAKSKHVPLRTELYRNLAAITNYYSGIAVARYVGRRFRASS